MAGFLRAVAFGGPLLWSSVSIAAPYCLVVVGVPPQCIYEDPKECQRDAGKQSGNCEAQGGARGNVSVGSGSYCLSVRPGVGQCGYVTLDSCNTEARRLRGACYHDPSGVGAPNPLNSGSGGVFTGR